MLWISQLLAVFSASNDKLAVANNTARAKFRMVKHDTLGAT
jgi:hypothetical protein